MQIKLRITVPSFLGGAGSSAGSGAGFWAQDPGSVQDPALATARGAWEADEDDPRVRWVLWVRSARERGGRVFLLAEKNIFFSDGRRSVVSLPIRAFLLHISFFYYLTLL
jgi:hypothetical protein